MEAGQDIFFLFVDLSFMDNTDDTQKMSRYTTFFYF